MDRFEVHFHSEYSNIRLIDCINRIEPSILRAHEIGLKGIALTDHEALCGHVDWLLAEQKLKKENKISSDFKCALGNEIYLVDERKPKQKYYHSILIAKDTIGHRQLRELSSTAWMNSYADRKVERVPLLKKELEDKIKENPGHLIYSSACLGSELATWVLALCEAERVNNPIEIRECKQHIHSFVTWLDGLFGDDFYIEIAPGTSKDQLIYNNRVQYIAKAYNKKIVIGTDAHFLSDDKRSIHEAFLKSKDEGREVESFYKDAWLMDEENIQENLKDIFLPKEIEAIFNNSIEIFDKIEGYDLFHNPIIPKVEVEAYGVNPSSYINDYPTLKWINENGNNQERYWLNQCLEFYQKKNLINKEYFERLETEADVIKYIGDKLGDCLFAYFNTFQHFIDLFWECGSIVGPGRGSATGFISNYSLGITQLDPIKWELPWFRFLNKERAELPSLMLILGSCKKRTLTIV